jgi:hypothetical protein
VLSVLVFVVVMIFPLLFWFWVHLLMNPCLSGEPG